MEKNHIILVPWDFTEVSQNALEHAIVFAKRTNNDIALVHIIKSEKDTDKAQKDLEEVAKKNQEKYHINTKAIIREGSIFNSISEVASELEANLVVMGTHGMRGMQKLTGSWALKVIISSQVPFIVVQEKPQNAVENIVFPVDFRKETREKLNWVHYLSKYYQCKIHIFKRSDPALRKSIEGNIQFAKKYFQNHNIDYEITTEKSKHPFPVETINFAKEINAGLILIMTSRNLGFADYVMGPDEQYIIANSAKIPVMCVNPRPVNVSGSFRAGG